MEFYLAPMEGITGSIFRNAHAEVFGPLDKYFTPFLAANANGKFSTREWEDICPDHNVGKRVVPQILTNRAEDFLATARTLQALGYKEVNLNLGCPSGTVVSKNRGSGFLAQKEELDRFLDRVCGQLEMSFSIKTRLGKDDPGEFEALMAIFNQYPLLELIIHPRIQKDYYKYSPRLSVFMEALKVSKMPICYNGDIFTAQHYTTLHAKCPEVEKIMLGRGLIANPGLVAEISQQAELTKSQLKDFHDRLFIAYQYILSGERNVLFKMKEAWFYMIYMFSNHEKYAKKIRKAQHFKDYELAIATLFEEQELVKGAGLFSTPQNE